MLGSIQFIPFYEVGQLNFREGAASLAEVRGWAFPPRRVLTLAMPNFFGNPAHHTYVDVFSGEEISFGTNYYGQPNPSGAGTSDWGLKNYVEGGIYLGVLPLFLSLLGIWSLRRRSSGPRSAITFFTLLALVSLAFIFGTPLYAILHFAGSFLFLCPWRRWPATAWTSWLERAGKIRRTAFPANGAATLAHPVGSGPSFCGVVALSLPRLLPSPSGAAC
jgi:hypothetical protein